jgi:hypothetical protein
VDGVRAFALSSMTLVVRRRLKSLGNGMTLESMWEGASYRGYIHSYRRADTSLRNSNPQADAGKRKVDGSVTVPHTASFHVLAEYVVGSVHHVDSIPPDFDLATPKRMGTPN